MPTRISILGVRVPEAILDRRHVLPIAGTLVALLALLEYTLKADFSLGILYVIPIAIAGTAMSRIEIVILAILCAFVRGIFTQLATPLEYALRFLMATLAYSGVGLFVVELHRSRRALISYYASIKLEQELRQKAEEQMRILAESSPAAILTANHEGVVIAANRAAAELFGLDGSDTLAGRPVGLFVAALANALKVPSGPRQMRASAWTWGRKLDGTTFPIAAWFSTYGQDRGRHLAAIVVDISEEVRDRERENFRHFLDYNRLLAGAVSHEIRNLCSAASVVCSSLRRRPDIESDADFQALAQLVEGLSRMASFELQHGGVDQQATASVAAVLDHLRVIVEPDWQDCDGAVAFEIDDGLPPVKADEHGLLQVLLNLAQNSLRAAQEWPVRRLSLRAFATSDRVTISVVDSGPGVADPTRLFQPFRPDSDGTGLGLYISRTLARSFGGDLVYVRGESGCRFDVTLAIARKTLHATDSTVDQNSTVPA
jgi:PAS domain S-box-containing protein